MNKFKDLFESTPDRAIFHFAGTEAKAEKKALQLFECLANPAKNDMVTVEAVNAYEGDTSRESMIHILGAGPTRNWNKLVKQIENKHSDLEFERFIP